jgi:cytochrome b561
MLNRGFEVAQRPVAMRVGMQPAAPALPAQASTAAPDEPAARHPALTRALHWGTAIAIVVAVAAMFVRDAVEDKALRQLLLEAHRQLGMLVLFAAVLRITARLRVGLADHAPDLAAALRRTAGAAHVLLYGLLIALPLVGWALCSAHGISLACLGVMHLPSLVSPDSELADTLSDYHIWLAWGLLALVAAHVVAALWHHFVRRDAVLTAMSPIRRRSSAP